MYGKIIDGQIVYAPNPMLMSIMNKETGQLKKFDVYNPTSEQYTAEGYLEIIKTAYPSTNTDKYYDEHYVERNGKIYLEWVECDPPIEPNTNFETVNTTDETSVILRSSSPNSTKRFRLTIDDNGELFVNELR